VIETEQSISISAAMESVWEYVKDIRNWAALMPGCRSCTPINPDDSRWVMKVGAGGLVRTVNILVHVERWDAPAEVKFTYQLDGDPVIGAGSYRASRRSARETGVTLKIRVEGSGPMSPLWEAMSKPLLPQLAQSFAAQLKAEIEKAENADGAKAPVSRGSSSVLGALGRWLCTRWRTLLGMTGESS